VKDLIQRLRSDNYMEDEVRSFIDYGNRRAAAAVLNVLPAPGDIRALKHRIHELEGEVIGYKRLALEKDAAAVLAERERCAAVAENWWRDGPDIAAAIRKGTP